MTALAAVVTDLKAKIVTATGLTELGDGYRDLQAPGPGGSGFRVRGWISNTAALDSNDVYQIATLEAELLYELDWTSDAPQASYEAELDANVQAIDQRSFWLTVSGVLGFQAGGDSAVQIEDPDLIGNVWKQVVRAIVALDP